ncbi:sodium:solute symporter family protein [Variovorax sp. J22G73]|jgi:SSS family solute:Na+ symporter|uniref:sodium:solute symporter family protein n=1 Tax=unclassified Variovorax TaxID=663243 RepID=UPI000D5F6233|nr:MULTISPECIES: sodium:solute symporter family protein [unclassified Variovorax]MDM0003200.1 sodium:solute symporter family protein [Variovorax sp. J22R203]MDM0097134.1 sodium:solute symporter family protein [Variovorax sp. J22G73]
MKLAIVLAILLATVAGAMAYGRRASHGKSFADWAVGGRSLGTLVFWFMNAGEVYTTFAVLGISGYAWALGAPAYLAFCSVSMSYALGYWLMPKIWRAGRLGRLLTQPDFFAARYDAPWLGVLTGVVGIASLVVYVQIQLVSLGLIVQLTLGNSISSEAATLGAGVLMIAFVFAAGMRSAAFAAGVKDILMVVVVVLLSATVASKVGAASLMDLFSMAESKYPNIGKLPGLNANSPTTAIWLMTSAINIALGNWVFPHLFQMSYAAHSATAIRRNAIWQPLYSLAYFFIILLGFAALLAGTQPPGGNLNAALLQFVSDRYPAWTVGLLAGTGFLLALAPGSLLLLTAGSIFTRNVVQPFRPGMSERRSLALSRGSLVVFAAVAVWLSISQKGSLVKILLDAYSAIGMLAPGVFLGFLWKRTTAVGVLAGLVAGFVALLAPFAANFWAAVVPQWEAGLIAMAINAAVVATVSLATRPPPRDAIAIGLQDRTA